jgi:quercetin dioxygenase-like cupin family protein
MKPNQIVMGVDATVSTPEPGLTRHMLAYDPQLMLVRNVMVSGWVGAQHSHPHSQAIYILSGHIRLALDGKVLNLYAGDTVVIDGGMDHQATAIADSEVLDVFTPHREDFLA